MAKISLSQEDQSSVNLPYANVFLDDNPTQEGMLFEVVKVFLTKSGTGYIFQTDCFNAFLYSTNKICSQVIEMLVESCQNKTPLSISVYLKRSCKGSIAFEIEDESDIHWYGLKGTFTHSNLENDGVSEEGFLGQLSLLSLETTSPLSNVPDSPPKKKRTSSRSTSPEPQAPSAS